MDAKNRIVTVVFKCGEIARTEMKPDESFNGVQELAAGCLSEPESVACIGDIVFRESDVLYVRIEG